MTKHRGWGMIGPMALYFAYGSNMRTARLTRRVGAARVVGAAHLDGFALRFDKPGRDGTGKANLVQVPGARVWGVAYALSDDAWPILDRFEPGYRREAFRLERPRGEPLDAIAYRYPSDVTSAFLAPSDAYLEHILAGANEHGLPAEWIGTIRSAARVA